MVGVVLLFLGGLLFFNLLGLGWLIRVVISLFIIIYATKKLNRAETSTHKGVAIAALIFGILLLFGGVHKLFGLMVGIGLVYVGMKLFKRDEPQNASNNMLNMPRNTISVQEDAFDKEWNKKMKK